MEGNPGLRPLSFGEILDVALKIFGRHWQTLVACVLVPTVPLQILSVLVVLSIAPEQFDLDGETAAAPEGTGTEIAAVLVVQLLSALASLLAWAACFKAVADGYLGRDPSVGRSLRFGLPKILRLLGLAIVTGIMVLIGLFGFLIGALFVAALVILSPAALLFERIGVFSAIGRSFELVRGRYWAIVLLVVVIFLAFLVIGVVFGGILGAVAGAAGSEDETAGALVSFISNTALTAVNTPLFAAIVTVLYFDQRVRKEGFDLQLLAEGMGEQPAFTGAPEPQSQPPQQAYPPAQPASGGTSGWQPPSSSTPPPGSPGDP
jgi:hypothetical protein